MVCISSNNKEAIDSLLDGIKHLISESLEAAPFDRVKNGKVLYKNDDGTYGVLIEERVYTAIALFDSGFIPGSVVKVLIPQNNYSDVFIINTCGSGTKIPKITVSTTDLVAGTSPLPDGEFYFVYE